MNSKIANVIAVELGILIAILAWLAFSRLPSVRQPRVAEEQERAAGSFATVRPVLKTRDQRLSATDYRADRQGEQQEDEEQAPTVQQYDQQIATPPYASSNLDDGVITEGSPYYYAEADQPPVVSPPDYLGSPFDQIVAYPQPTEIIVFSNARSFWRRNRLPPRFCGGPTMVAHRPPVRGGGGPQVRGGGSVPHRNPPARPLRPSQGLRAH